MSQRVFWICEQCGKATDGGPGFDVTFDCLCERCPTCRELVGDCLCDDTGDEDDWEEGD